MRKIDESMLFLTTQLSVAARLSLSLARHTYVGIFAVRLKFLGEISKRLKRNSTSEIPFFEFLTLMTATKYNIFVAI